MKSLDRAYEIIVAICAFLCFASGGLVVVGGVIYVLSGSSSDLPGQFGGGAVIIILGSFVMAGIAFAVYEEVKVKDEKPEE